MQNEIQDILQLLARGKSLTADQSSRAFQIIMAGGATPAQIGALLMALHSKGETVDEILGAATVLRAKCVPFQAPEHTIDTCGTGGDAKGTVNISTATALVVAACGVPVAKHGNRGVSSRSGSADVLAVLDVNVNAEPSAVERSLREGNIGFLMAPKFHSAMRHVGPVRQELGFRTIFNLIGPLINPARPKRQLVGVYHDRWLVPFAEVLRAQGTEHAWVVHSIDGLDEITVTAETHVAELKDGEIRTFTITPEEAGFARSDAHDLHGGSAEQNAQALMSLLSGKEGAYRDAVLFNAAAALLIAGKVTDLQGGIAMATEALDCGAAKEALSKLVYFSHAEA